MKYRRLGKTDWDVSVLGFGAMRLPTLDNDPLKVNEPLAIEMIRRGIDQGINYVDTAYPYHGGQSEVVVGKALQDGYREKIRLATKQPCWLVEKTDDFDKFLNEQLKKLQTDHIDFYLLHTLNRTFWPKVRDLDVLEWAEKAIADGRIGHLGFSFHDDLELFKEIVDAYDKWTLSQIQYNFLDVEFQAGRQGMKYAHDKGLAVVVMEPIRGGQIAQKPPEAVAKIWASAKVQRALPDWALQWVWNHPEISVALSGMTTMQQLEENLTSADQSGAGSLSKEELSIIDNVREEFTKLCPVPCTGCRYCMPCPNGVDIPYTFLMYNEAIMYDNPRKGQLFYQRLPADNQADKCVECFECEDACPQQISIVQWLKKAHDLLGPEE
ncbi:MAG: aldo/keto reductase [Proteobacteria bacterium]|nr:aldo/keto reductase [Pseudomonadota bacterium]MBU4471252.1 aldo/keto reductase [Pseudomonadota bacterium]MCG2752853.1 aldo/keto reductase [Desulfobacteraceae bacterium]